MLYKTTDSSPTSKIFRAHANRKPFCSLWKNIPILRIKRGPFPTFCQLKNNPRLFVSFHSRRTKRGFFSRKLAVSDPFDLGPQVSTSQLTPSPRKLETKNPEKSRKIRESCFGGRTLPCQHFGWCFFSSETTKKFQTLPGMNSTRGPGWSLLRDAGKLRDMSGFPPHQSKIAPLRMDQSIQIRVFESLTPFLWPVVLETFVGCKKIFMSNLFWENKHVISWFFKNPGAFLQSFFHIQFWKDVSRSPWASEAEKKLEYRLGADCYSKPTGGS